MATVIEMPDGTELEFPDGMDESAMQAAAAKYWQDNGQASGVADGATFPDPADPGSGAGRSPAGNPVLAGAAGPDLAAGQAPGAEEAAGGVEGAGLLDYLGALPGVAQVLDVRDMITQGVEPSEQFPYFALPQSISDRRELGNDITGYGELLVGGAGAGAGLKAGGRIAAEFAPDVAGGLLGGAVGGGLIPGLGHLAGTKLGARMAANAFGRGKGIASRTSRAIKGKAKGSPPSAPPATARQAPSEHATAVQQILLGTTP